jgi:transcriptional regulator with XRE-family HTH domain
MRTNYKRREAAATPDPPALVAAVCDHHGWTTTELASAIGVSVRSVQAWREGERRLSSRHRARLEQLLEDPSRRVDVYALRERLRLGQADLAKHFGVSVKTYARWESRGQVPASKKELLAGLEAAAPNPVRAARERLGYTQHELARLLGVSWSLVSQWERGRPMPEERHRQLAEIGSDPETTPTGDRIREWREAHDLSLHDVARRLGGSVRAAHVREWERSDSDRPVPLRYHRALRRLFAPRATDYERDRAVFELVKSTPAGMSTREVAERFPAHDYGAVLGSLNRYVTHKHLFRAWGVIEDRHGRPLQGWRFYPQPPPKSRPLSPPVTGVSLQRDLAKLRKRGWTRRMVAAELGVSRAALGSWIDHRHAPIPPSRQRMVHEGLARLSDKEAPRARRRRPPRPASAIPDVRAQRVEAGLTQAVLAERVGVPREQMNRWERGVPVPEEMAPRISAALAALAEDRITAADLRACQAQAGWSRRELAEYLGVKESRVKHWLQGRSIPSRVWRMIHAQLENAPTQSRPDRRRSAILTAVQEQPGVSISTLAERLSGDFYAIRAEVESLIAANQLHARPTRHTGPGGSPRTGRPARGLYLGSPPAIAEPKPLPGPLLREARKARGLTQSELARRVPTSASVMGRWERSAAGVPPEFRDAVHNALEADMSPPSDPWARKLREARAAAGLTLGDVARAAGVTIGAVSSWERGQAIPSADRQSVVASALAASWQPAPQPDPVTVDAGLGAASDR